VVQKFCATGKGTEKWRRERALSPRRHGDDANAVLVLVDGQRQLLQCFMRIFRLSRSNNLLERGTVASLSSGILCWRMGIGLQVGLHETWQPHDFLGNLLCTLVCIARGSTHAMHAKQCLRL
jgi:hypothetical protein